MRGKSMKRRLMKVFPHREDEKKPFEWFRQYFNPKTNKVEIMKSPTQQNPKLMFAQKRD